MNDQIQDFFEKSLVENHIDNELYPTNTPVPSSLRKPFFTE